MVWSGETLVMVRGDFFSGELLHSGWIELQAVLNSFAVNQNEHFHQGRCIVMFGITGHLIDRQTGGGEWRRR